MSYFYGSDFVGTSPTQAGILGEDLTNGSHKAVMYDENENVVLATDSTKAMGILLSSTGKILSKGDTVSYLISNIGLMEIGEAVNRGDLVSVNGKGQAVVAKTGSTVFGRAFTSGTKENSLIQVMVCPVGSILGG